MLRDSHHGSGLPSRKNPPLGPWSPKGAAHAIEAAPCVRGRPPLAFALGVVAVRPGHTLLTRMPVSRSSSASLEVSALSTYVGGIRPATPGYGHVIIAPEPGELEWARVVYRSVRGQIASAWRREGDELRLEVEIPANVTATVVVPGGETAEVGSGRHTFTAAG